VVSEMDKSLFSRNLSSTESLRFSSWREILDQLEAVGYPPFSSNLARLLLLGIIFLKHIPFLLLFSIDRRPPILLTGAAGWDGCGVRCDV